MRVWWTVRVAADDLSDLSEWQRALFNLRSSEKLLTSTGDLMYMICAVMMEIAERQDRRRRMKGRKIAGTVAAGRGGGRRSARIAVGADTMANIIESDGALKRNGRRWSESDTERPSTSVGIMDVPAT